MGPAQTLPPIATRRPLSRAMCWIFARAERAWDRRREPRALGMCGDRCARCPLEREVPRAPPTRPAAPGLEALEALDLGARSLVVARGGLRAAAVAYLLFRAARERLPALVRTSRGPASLCLDLFEAEGVPLRPDGAWWKRATLEETRPVCGRKVVAGALSGDDWRSMATRSVAFAELHLELAEPEHLPSLRRSGLLLVEATPAAIPALARALPSGQPVVWVCEALPALDHGELDAVVWLVEREPETAPLRACGIRAKPRQLELPGP